MVLAFIGLILVMIGAVLDSGPNWLIIIIGAILAVVGFLYMRATSDAAKARANRTRYWAEGGPDKYRR